MLAAGAAFVVALTIWLLYFSSLFAVHHISISGEQTIAAAEIESAAKVPFDTPLIDADLGRIRQRVQAMPGIESATVSRSWPQTISITVVERMPVAVVATKTGLRNIDANGVLFGHRPRRPAGIPLINLAGNVDKSALEGAVTVAASLPPSILKQVTSITVRTMDDIRLNLTQGRHIRWGNASDSATKAEVATALLRLHRRVIDVSVPSNPATG